MSFRSQPPRNGDTEAVGFGDVRRRHHRDDQLKFFTIAEVAERLGVATSTVRRWIKSDNLVVYRIGGVVRVAKVIRGHF